MSNSNSSSPNSPDSDHRPDAIAVVGVSALFPGSLDATGFWRDILGGKDLMSDVPADHWLVEDYYGEPGTPDKIYTKRGAFLKDVDFDPMHWGMPPGNLSSTDTAQLLALIVAQKVLEDASRSSDFESLDRDRISVILGVASATELVGQMASRIQRPVWQRALRESGLPESKVSEACDRIADSYADWNESTFPGVLGNVVAGRIANRLNLGGTNCVIDAACASSLAGMSMAVQELQLGTSDLVITGGVDALNDPFMFMCFSQTPALSPTADCRPFSDEADGTMLGEGLGMVALKRLADAERDQDRIYAVLRGIGSSSDGKSKSVYAPVSSGQAKALRRAYERAGYEPDTVELVEAHGTATKAGDVAEIGGLREVFEATEAYGKGEKQWCALGSVKSQIGHTKAAAGAASFVKVVLALHHKVLPPTIKVNRPNPALNITDSPFYLSTRTRPWIRAAEHPRRGSVSSFGFGGSNFHVALEEYAGPGNRAYRLRTQPAEIFLFHGPTGADLAADVRRIVDAVADRESFLYESYESLNRFDPSSVARLAIVASDHDDLRTKAAHAVKSIESDDSRPMDLPIGIYYMAGEKNSAPDSGEGETAFLFPGQGSQYVGMGEELAWNFDGARAIWDRIASSENPALNELPAAVYPSSVFGEAQEQEQQDALTATHRAQPAIGLVSLSMMSVLGELGLQADYFAGHSFGELTALYAAGACDESVFLAAARKRGELMGEAAKSAAAPGAMTAVFHDVDGIRSILDGSGDGVVLANLNTPKQVVIAGSVAGIESIEADLRAQGIENKRLPVATAFHSKYVSESTKPFAEFLKTVPFQTPRGKVYSNVNAGPYQNGSGHPDAIRARLAEQIASPVRFFEQIEAMYTAGARTFVEVGPSSVLSRLTAEILGDRPHTVVSLDQKNQSGMLSLYRAVAKLSAAGIKLNLDALWKDNAAPTDPAAHAKPKLTIKINGSNYAKPYPPAGGAADLPQPNPESNPEPARTRTVTASTPSETTRADTSMTARAINAPPSGFASPVPESLPKPAASLPNPIVSASEQSAYLNTYQEMQRQTAQAHTAYQQALAESHQSYLRVAETAFQSLNAMMDVPVVASQAGMPATSAPIVAPFSPPPAAPLQEAEPTINAPLDSPAIVPKPAAPNISPPATSSAADVSFADLEALMLKTVAEKTGYPVEMLEPDMELEAGLGIDSIKRVQILSAIKQQNPNLPEMDPKHLGTLRTLREIVDYMQKALPAAGSPSAESADHASPSTPAVDTEALKELMLRTVAEKTGYPAEMLELDMELEAGLGIDSIKRVQILSAIKQQNPNLPEMDPKHLGTLRTLREIVDYMQKALPAAGSPPAESADHASPSTPTVDTEALKELMLRTVAEKTGYPAEMLELDMELEAGLGIDSIKRVQILSAIKQQNPNLPEMDPKHLGTLRTLREIVDYMEGRSTASGESLTLANTAPERPVTRTEAPARFALKVTAAPAAGFGLPGLSAAKYIAITQDGRGIAEALAKLFVAAGRPAEVLENVPAHADAVISLAGLRETADEAAAIAVNREAFAHARAVAERFSGDSQGVFVTVQDCGGDFGLGSSGGALERLPAFRGGIAGLAKTAAHEWPRAGVKAIDINCNGCTAEEIARKLYSELTAGGSELEVGLTAANERVVPLSYSDKLTSNAMGAGQASFVNQDSVIVASAGARGVTAKTVIALAKAHRPRFALLGRTPLEEEAPGLRGINDDAALKKALLAEAVRRGEKPTPIELNKQAASIQANREVLATLAELEAAGSQARYYAVDVTNRTDLKETFERIRADWGSITGLIHGAGVLADKLIAQKTPEQFDRVFDTKVEGLRNLLSATDKDPLSYICLFSSVAGRAGNAGQCDYAMANEILNKVANAEARKRGAACLVKSMNWGPWEGGMVTPELKEQFQSMGVPLIPVETGAKMLVDEIQKPRPEQVEIVLGGSPTLSPRMREYRGELNVSSATYGFLKDHAIQGVPVVPMVLIIEWASRAAKGLHPELAVRACRDLRMLKGIRLENFQAGMALRVTVREGERAGLLECTIAAPDGTPHYSCIVEMSADPAPSPTTVGALSENLEPWPFTAEEIYGERLFHGPGFQVIQALRGVSREAGEASLEAGKHVDWAPGEWRTDIGVLDGGMQLALLWTSHVLGKKNLPTGLDEYIIHDDVARSGPVRCILRGRTPDNLHARIDLIFAGENDMPLVEMRGIEMHVLSDA